MTFHQISKQWKLQLLEISEVVVMPPLFPWNRTQSSEHTMNEENLGLHRASKYVTKDIHGTEEVLAQEVGVKPLDVNRSTSVKQALYQQGFRCCFSAIAAETSGITCAGKLGKL